MGARPGLRLQEQFPVQAIPTDTLRAVLDQPGLLRRVTWRAASGTRQRVAVERNAPAVNRAALALMQAPDSPVLATLTPEQQGQALETAYDDLYSRYIAREVPKADTPETLRQLLVMRSRVPVPDQRVTPVRPVVDPAGGHGTSRWGVAVGHDHEDFAVLRLMGLRANSVVATLTKAGHNVLAVTTAQRSSAMPTPALIVKPRLSLRCSAPMPTRPTAPAPASTSSRPASRISSSAVSAGVCAQAVVCNTSAAIMVARPRFITFPCFRLNSFIC